jgi:hypothetical protein
MRYILRIPVCTFAVVFTLIAALQTCRAQAEQSDFADIDHFFHANYNLTNLAEYAKRPVGDISYLLVSWSEYNDVQQRYLDGGYVKLGESYYASTGGIPENDAAIRYARSIGAEAVVYTSGWAGKFDSYGRERSDHRIGFYARARASSGSARVAFTYMR